MGRGEADSILYGAPPAIERAPTLQRMPLPGDLGWGVDIAAEMTALWNPAPERAPGGTAGPFRVRVDDVADNEQVHHFVEIADGRWQGLYRARTEEIARHPDPESPVGLGVSTRYFPPPSWGLPEGAFIEVRVVETRERGVLAVIDDEEAGERLGEEIYCELDRLLQL